MRGEVERHPCVTGQPAGVLEVAEAVGEHAGGDHDQRDRGPVEERAHVEVDRPAVQQPAEQDRGGDPDRRAGQRARRLSRRLGRRPQEEGRLEPLAADGEERGQRERARPDRGGALHLAAQVRRQAGRGAPHPEDHRGDEADGEHAEQATDRLLAGAGQHADGEGQHGGERAGEGHRAEHAEPDRRGRCGRLTGSPGPGPVFIQRGGLAHRRQQDGHYEARFEALTEPDQQVRYAVRPSHGN